LLVFDDDTREMTSIRNKPRWSLNNDCSKTSLAARTPSCRPWERANIF